MSFNTREAVGADAAAMAEIEKLCFSSPWSFEDLLREIEENEPALYIVCEEGSRVVAYAGLWIVSGEGHVMNVAVRPGFRGRGIGAAVVGSLIGRARGLHGVAEFTLEVRASNAAARRLYERLGFREEGRREGYYSEPKEDAVIMWLRYDI
jgi:ribosomal-protein-alanine N-acetyltransferase